MARTTQRLRGEFGYISRGAADQRGIAVAVAAYLRTRILPESYRDLKYLLTKIASLLVNEDVRQNQELAARVDKPVPFVDFVLGIMESKNHIKLAKYLGGYSQVWEISSLLRRALQG
jgi:hypothetical protein